MAPTPTPPSPSPAIQQFLSSVLSQRGPSALPYSEDTKWLIRQHLLALVTSCPSLEPKTASFTHNDGRSINLLQADGTIPMLFQGVTYNIPVIIWLMDSYPRYPPCVYVNPTHDMIIKRPHAHVNPSGLVSVSYLQNWVYPSSNLLDLIRELSSVFGRDPPLYAQRRPNSNPNPNPNPNQSPSPSHSQSYGSNPSNLSQTSSFGSVTGPGHGRYQQPMARPYPPSPYGSGGGIPARAHQTDDAAEIYRRDAINKIVEMAHGDMSQLRRSREAEMEGLFNGQGVLRRREEDVKRGLKELQDEKEGLEAQLQAVLTNSDVLEAWVRENEGKVSANLGEVDADGAFECMDSLSKQILECTAADLAIEDVVYSLDKAVQEGAVSFDQYLRNVRFLSRDQFFHRATGTKVRAVQMQAQVASMAARIQQYTL